jgi:hypothetical protein
VVGSMRGLNGWVGVCGCQLVGQLQVLVCTIEMTVSCISYGGLSAFLRDIFTLRSDTDVPTGACRRIGPLIA